MIWVESKVGAVWTIWTGPRVGLVKKDGFTDIAWTEDVLKRVPRERETEPFVKMGISGHQVIFAPSLWLVHKACKKASSDENHAAVIFRVHWNPLIGAQGSEIIYQTLSNEVVVSILVTHGEGIGMTHAMDHHFCWAYRQGLEPE
jgi:hypothetical protein